MEKSLKFKAFEYACSCGEIDRDTTEAVIVYREEDNCFAVITYCEDFESASEYGESIQGYKQDGFRVVLDLDVEYEIEAVRSVSEDGEDLKEIFDMYF